MMTFDLNPFKLLTPIPAVYLIPDYLSEPEESYLTTKVDEVGNSNAIVQPDGRLSIRSGGWQSVAGRRSMQWGGTLSPKGRLLPQRLPGFMNQDWPNVFQRLQDFDLFKPLDSFQSVPTPPNHCLVNEYLPGQGILPHQDGPAYFSTVATLSLESDIVYDFYCYSEDYFSLSSKLESQTNHQSSQNPVPTFTLSEAPRPSFVSDPNPVHSPLGRTIAPDPLFSVFVPRRSLIIITSECYENLLHSIPTRAVDNLTEHLKTCLNWSDFQNELVHGQLERQRRLSLTCRRVKKVMKGLCRFGK
ncbi:hypothetical protein O181_012172 [Austropuccinia psidii MF-1]|uniref:Fe2OG dioxygenase domain-containing protein n=1 Tax=Austropuccinia psidii MF-1 TaxID=1389203 RepID=A0A9Q3BX57_9BASI|nr:hypothetical protein [Austropuccinia psidii MF-1]